MIASSKKQTWFISDLHLDAAYPKSATAFFHLLQQANEQVDAIYILGDLFEMWIGDDDLSSFHNQIMAALQAVTKKSIPIFILHGNRDFLLGSRFMQATGCEWLADETTISVYGEPVLLMHGDTLCTRDIQYLRARKKARNPLYQSLFLWLPLFVRRYLAKRVREKSRRYTQMVTLEVMDVTQSAVVTVMEKAGVQILIHGHTHQQAIHRFSNHAQSMKRIVLNAWHDQGYLLIWEEQSREPYFVTVPMADS